MSRPAPAGVRSTSWLGPVRSGPVRGGRDPTRHGSPARPGGRRSSSPPISLSPNLSRVCCGRCRKCADSRPPSRPGRSAHDEVDELARHDDRPRLACRPGAPAPSATPSRARPAPPPAARPAPRTGRAPCRSPGTTSSIVSRSSSDSSATGHGSLPEPLVAEPRPQLLGDVRRVRLDQRHRRLGREPRGRVVRRRATSSFTSSITAAIGVLKTNRRSMSSVTLRDRLVRLARERRAGATPPSAVALELPRATTRHSRGRKRAMPSTPVSCHSLSWSAGPMNRM